MTAPETHPYLIALIQQQEYIGLVGLGKLADPMTGRAEVDLDKTRMAIGLMEMLEQKTAGNVSAEERADLRRVLTALRLNFVEEQRRQQDAPPPPPPTPPADEPEVAGGATEDAGQS